MGMKGGISPLNALGAVALGPAFVSYRQGLKAQDTQEAAANAALAAADKTAKLAEEAMNKQNQKRPNAAGLLSSNQAAAKGGQAGTFLTGPGGIDPSSLALGKTTLLGGGG